MMKAGIMLRRKECTASLWHCCGSKCCWALLGGNCCVALLRAFQAQLEFFSCMTCSATCELQNVRCTHEESFLFVSRTFSAHLPNNVDIQNDLDRSIIQLYFPDAPLIRVGFSSTKQNTSKTEPLYFEKRNTKFTRL